MKDTFTDANFPKSADGRVYHLGIRPGEVANRILTVGSPSRAEAIARLLDGDAFKLSSERGFVTITGCYNGVPISIISIGMGYPNMDFFVREARECVSGDLIIIRLGSCGGLVGLPVGTLVVPSASVSIRRNYDYDFASESPDASGNLPYQISRLVPADPELHDFLSGKLKSTAPLDPPAIITSHTVNASADSFYSSQGRQTSFPDHNETLIDDLMRTVPDLGTLEMETFHLLHLASVWHPRQIDSIPKGPRVPPTTLPVVPALTRPPTASLATSSAPLSSTTGTAESSQSSSLADSTPRIRAAAVQMIFANRNTQDFISPTRVKALETWSGRAVLEALCSFHIPEEKLHTQSGSVWESRL